jgi:hypothetical protein
MRIGSEVGYFNNYLEFAVLKIQENDLMAGNAKSFPKILLPPQIVEEHRCLS